VEGKSGTPALGTPAEPVPLPALVETLKKFKDALLVVDAGFAGSKDARSASKAKLPTDMKAPWAKAAGTVPFPVLVAARTGKPAHESEDLGHGVFTASFLEGMKGAADLDGNKTVTLGELKKYLASQVSGLSQVLEKAQEPLLLGGKNKEALFPAPPKKKPGKPAPPEKKPSKAAPPEEKPGKAATPEKKPEPPGPADPPKKAEEPSKEKAESPAREKGESASGDSK
jgi:hypothetical protein